MRIGPVAPQPAPAGIPGQPIPALAPVSNWVPELPLPHTPQGGRAPEEGTEPGAVGTEYLDRLVAQVNERLGAFRTRLSFHVDEASQRIVVEVIDEAEGKVIRQIPPEQVLEAAKLIDRILGLLLDERY